MELCLVFLAGLLLGVCICSIIYRTYRVGTLRIDTSDPNNKPYMFLELDKGFGDISKKKNVILNVKREDYIPHK